MTNVYLTMSSTPKLACDMRAETDKLSQVVRQADIRID
jgi:hypothetical protein